MPEQAFQNEGEGAYGLHEVQAVKRETFAQEVLGLLTASTTDGGQLDGVSVTEVDRVAEAHPAVGGAVGDVDDDATSAPFPKRYSCRHDGLARGSPA